MSSVEILLRRVLLNRWLIVCLEAGWRRLRRSVLLAGRSSLRGVVQFNWSCQNVLALQLCDGSLSLLLLSEPQEAITLRHLSHWIEDHLRLVDGGELLLHEGHQHRVVHIRVEIADINLIVSCARGLPDSSLPRILLKRLVLALAGPTSFSVPAGAVTRPVELEAARSPRNICSI